MSEAPLSWSSFREALTPKVEQALGEALEDLALAVHGGTSLCEAMRYGVMAGGKRLRPLATLAAAQACGGPEESALQVGVAIEFVHAYSLIHDDLPALDNDDIRRGKPTCHKKFGEAMAILAGDGLLTHAFALLAGALPDREVARGVRLLSQAAGPLGMVGGQAEDIAPCPNPLTQEVVERIHRHKTAKLFEAALCLGGMVAQAPCPSLSALSTYGKSLGVAFQVADDLLSFTGAEEELKRPTSSDRIHDRPLHPRISGPQHSCARAFALLEVAQNALGTFDTRGDPLRGLIDEVRARVHSAQERIPA